MKICFTIGVLLAAACAQASEFSDYVPDGWHMVSVAQGDLNHDMRTDAVLVLQKENGNGGDEVADGYPRMLKILLGENGAYREIVKNTWVIRPVKQKDGFCANDSFAGVNIEKGRLKIKSVCRFNGLGAKRLSEDSEQIYRYEDGKMRLIGDEYLFYLQDSEDGNVSTTSTNYLTGRRKIVIGDNVFKKNKKRPKIRWVKIEREKHYLKDSAEDETQ